MRSNLNKLIEDGEELLTKANSNYQLTVYDIYALVNHYGLCKAVIKAYYVGFALGSRYQLNNQRKINKEAIK